MIKFRSIEKISNDKFTNFSIKEIKNNVPRAIIIPGKAYPIPAIADKKLKPLKFWYLILTVKIIDNNIMIVAVVKLIKKEFWATVTK